MGWRALSTSLPHRRPASGSEITERIVAYPQLTERERPSQSNGTGQGAAMDYEGFFSDISTVPAPEASKGRAEPRHIDIRNSRSSLRGRDEHKTKVLTGFACRPAKRAIRRFGVPGFLPGCRRAHEFIG